VVDEGMMYSIGFTWERLEDCDEVEVRHNECLFVELIELSRYNTLLMYRKVQDVVPFKSLFKSGKLHIYDDSGSHHLVPR
jgi:hypothetical protein